MDFFKQGMKGPTRPAPPAPGFAVNRYSPVTNWNDDPFGSDVFEPNPQYTQKKKPPPRPPPPRVNKQPDIPAKPSHFMRKPTVLSSLLNAKKRNVANQATTNQSITNIIIEPDTVFPKCEPKNVSTGALIDLSSPPSSPTFTTRSSSDGLSVDSFGSDATTSTNHHNAFNGGSTSQAESGFEDDFDLFLNTRKISKEDTLYDFGGTDPFSPPAVVKPPIMKKPVVSKDLFDSSNSKSSFPLKGPTIIRAKPARPKPPDNSALLKSTFGNGLVTTMNLNITTPIQKVNGFADFDDAKPFELWENENSADRESSPPMPSIPPPPPPAIIEEIDLPNWTNQEPTWPSEDQDDEPHAIALFDYQTEYPDDLQFSAHTRIRLIRRENAEWLFGELRSGVQGLFPSNYVEIKVPLPNDNLATKTSLGTATALYDFEPDQPGDLKFVCGDTITLHTKLNDEWYFGECNGLKGQFPINYVQIH